MEHADILITNGLIVTMDDQMTAITDGSLAISGPDILAIGAATAMAERYTADTIIDARGQIVMPGLINGHVHTPDSLFRSLVEDLPLEAWLHKLFSAEQRFVSAETVELGSRLSIAEMISSGITTALDMFWFPERSAKAAKEIGFRLMTGPKPHYLEVKTGETALLAHSWVEGEAIYLWVRWPGDAEPRSYRLPWSEETAEQIEQAQEELQRDGGETIVEFQEGIDGVTGSSPQNAIDTVLQFDLSLDDRHPPTIYAMPQPSPPEKPVYDPPPTHNFGETDSDQQS